MKKPRKTPRKLVNYDVQLFEAELKVLLDSRATFSIAETDYGLLVMVRPVDMKDSTAILTDINKLIEEVKDQMIMYKPGVIEKWQIWEIHVKIDLPPGWGQGYRKVADTTN